VTDGTEPYPAGPVADEAADETDEASTGAEGVEVGTDPYPAGLETMDEASTGALGVETAEELTVGTETEP